MIVNNEQSSPINTNNIFNLVKIKMEQQKQMKN